MKRWVGRGRRREERVWERWVWGRGLAVWNMPVFFSLSLLIKNFARWWLDPCLGDEGNLGEGEEGGGDDKQKKRAFQILRSSRGVNVCVELR